MKFYLGKPYAKKYREECYPEMPEDDSGLYLDCCGLLRQATVGVIIVQ